MALYIYYKAIYNCHPMIVNNVILTMIFHTTLYVKWVWHKLTYLSSGKWHRDMSLLAVKYVRKTSCTVSNTLRCYTYLLYQVIWKISLLVERKPSAIFLHFINTEKEFLIDLYYFNSSTLKSVTPSPTCSISPAHSKPRMNGVLGGESIAPWRTIRSWKFRPL